MVEINVGFEFEDQQTAKDIAVFVKSLAGQAPPEVTSFREVTTMDGLEAADWHFMELLLAFGVGVGTGVAEKAGETVVDGIMWLAKAIRQRLASLPKSSVTATSNDDAIDEIGIRRKTPSVRMEFKSVSVTLTPTTTDEELQRFAKAVGRH